MDNWPLLSRLKKAVKKVSYLLNLTAARWRLATMLSTRRRRLSFDDRPPGLMACADTSDDDVITSEEASSTRGSSPAVARLQRTMSCPSEEEDIDKRAEMFIANFYRQLNYERQISLELRYCGSSSSRASSFKSITSQ